MIGNSCHLSDFRPVQFLDMSSLQAALPNPTLPAAFISGITDPWFHQSSATTYIDAVPQGKYYLILLMMENSSFKLI